MPSPHHPTATTPGKAQRRPLHRLAVVACTAALATALAACGATSPEPAAEEAAASAGAFPVTIEHALGTAEVPEEPQRVVTWGWGSADAAIALDVVPVAMPTQTYGGDEEGVLPWIRDAVEERGAELPELLPDSQEVPLEAIAAQEPDLVLAPYSGITQAEYDLLSQIAPTVAYPDEPWATPWQETIRMVGQALGRSDAAEALLAGIDEQVADAAQQHPELAGKTVAAVWSTPDAFYVYKPADARVGFTLDLGLESAPSVEALAEGDETFYYSLSRERLDELTSDVLVSYASSPEEQQAFLASPEGQLLPQVTAGAVAEVTGTELIAAVSPPTALSLTWGLEDYVAALSAAATAAAG